MDRQAILLSMRISEDVVPCSVCKTPLVASPDNFPRSGVGLKSRCKSCHTEDTKRRYWKDPKEWSLRAKEGRNRRKLMQAGRAKPEKCDVCGFVFTNKEEDARWDHNHKTGAFRGWLCNGCNAALGQAGENPEILTALAAYLKLNGAYTTRGYNGQPSD